MLPITLPGHVWRKALESNQKLLHSIRLANGQASSRLLLSNWQRVKESNPYRFQQHGFQDRLTSIRRHPLFVAQGLGFEPRKYRDQNPGR